MRDNTVHDITIGMKGRFELVAVKADGSGSRKLAEFDNLILDSGLDYYCSSQAASPLSCCRVGAGSTAPNVSQTNLVSQIAARDGAEASVGSMSSSAPYWFSRKRTWRFSAGAAAGNIAEVGVGWSTSGDTLFSRALVLDQNGNPTTVTVLSDEFLDVTYTLTCYPSADDSRATLTLAGNSYEVVSRIAYAGVVNQFVQPGQVLTQHPLAGQYSTYFYPGELGPITGRPSGDAAAVETPTVTPSQYTAGSFICEVSMRFGLDSANIVNGIKSMVIQPYSFCQYQIQFTPAVPKTNSQIFTIRFRLTFTRR